MNAPVISVVAPVYNGQATVGEFLRRTWDTLQSLALPFEILLVDDGSTDRSLEHMQRALRLYPGTRVIQLAANYGQANAIAAGLRHARGEYCVVMDSDLQDRPEDIPALYRGILGRPCDMVIASRRHPNRSFLRNLTSVAFYLAANFLTTIRHPRCAGVFRIIRRSCLAPVLAPPMQPGTVLSRLHALGCTWRTMPLRREPRPNDHSGYTPRKLLSLGLSRLLVFGRVPARQVGNFGICAALYACAAGLRRHSLSLRLLGAALLGVSLVLKDANLLRPFTPRYKIRRIITEQP